MVVQAAFANGSSGFKQVSVYVISPSTQSERTFSTSLTVGALKTKLESVTGIPASSQKISIQSNEAEISPGFEISQGTTLAILNHHDDEKTLYECGLTHDWLVLKVDSDDNSIQKSLSSHVEDPNVRKFELSKDEYAKRNDTVMAYKARNKIGRFASPSAADDESMDPELPSSFAPGARVVVDLSSTSTYLRKGTIRYIGPASFAKGTWVGVEYDEPVGKNDGSVDGKRYFTCKMKYGAFVRGEKCSLVATGQEDDDGDGMDTDEELGI